MIETSEMLEGLVRNDLLAPTSSEILHRGQQKRRQRQTISMVTSASLVAVVAMVAVGLWSQIQHPTVETSEAVDSVELVDDAEPADAATDEQQTEDGDESAKPATAGRGDDSEATDLDDQEDDTTTRAAAPKYGDDDYLEDLPGITEGDDSLVMPPEDVSVTVDGPDVVISWSPPDSAGSNVEWLTQIRPIGDAPDFRKSPVRYANDRRVDRLIDVPHGSYIVEVWAARIVDNDASYGETEMVSSAKVIREVSVNENTPLELLSIEVSDVLNTEPGHSPYLNLNIKANRCVYLEVTGATTFSRGYDGDACTSDIRTKLEAVEPGTHTITITGTGRDGSKIVATKSFTVDGSNREPCRFVEPPPDRWRVKIGEETSISLDVTGDCGKMSWQFEDWNYPGFTFDDGVLQADLTGVPRGEQVVIIAQPALSESFSLRLNVIAYNDEQPDVEPCTIVVAENPRDDGSLRLQVALGETRTAKIDSMGDCDSSRWVLPTEWMPGVTFEEGLLTVTGQGPLDRETFIIELIPEHGASSSLLIVIESTE